MGDESKGVEGAADALAVVPAGEMPTRRVLCLVDNSTAHAGRPFRVQAFDAATSARSQRPLPAALLVRDCDMVPAACCALSLYKAHSGTAAGGQRGSIVSRVKASMAELSVWHGITALHVSGAIENQVYMVGFSEDAVYVALRDAKTAWDMANASSVIPLPRHGGAFHAGLYSRSSATLPDAALSSLLSVAGDKRLVFCGFGTGASLAQCATIRLLRHQEQVGGRVDQISCIMFGAPFVGSKQAAVRHSHLGPNFLNVMFLNDPVVVAMDLRATVDKVGHQLAAFAPAVKDALAVRASCRGGCGWLPAGPRVPQAYRTTSSPRLPTAHLTRPTSGSSADGAQYGPRNGDSSVGKCAIPRWHFELPSHRPSTGVSHCSRQPPVHLVGLGPYDNRITALVPRRS